MPSNDDIISSESKRYFCGFCGRCSSEQSADSNFWPMYMRHIDPFVIMCDSCKGKHPDVFELYFSEFSEKEKEGKEEEPMKVKVRRDEIKETEIEVDVNELQVHDRFDLSKNGEVIATGTVFDAWTGVDGAYRIDATISFKKESKTCKKHYGCLDAADSYGESYVEIEQNGAKTIVHSDSVTVYPVRKEDE